MALAAVGSSVFEAMFFEVMDSMERASRQSHSPHDDVRLDRTQSSLARSMTSARSITGRFRVASIR
ncbi:MAG: hypothetical protein DWI02_07925 [Planctomycetota bacterium]|nr:MAG: hypothetical protein DWI02_07925 [Planctomycetota bacterium]